MSSSAPTRWRPLRLSQWHQIGWGHATLIVLAAVLAGTLSPFRFRDTFRSFWDVLSVPVGPDISTDIVSNVLLFVPLGFVVSGYLDQRRIRASALVVAIISLSFVCSYSIEVLQHLVPGRISSLSDVLANAGGGAFGAVAYSLWTNQKPLQTVAAYMLGLTLMSVPIQWTVTVKNWDAGFPLIVGNEHTGDRPWRGRVFEVSILDHAMSEDGVAGLFSRQPIIRRIPEAAVASYDLSGSCPCEDAMRQLPPLVWTRPGTGRAERIPQHVDGAWLESSRAATRLVDRIKQTSRMTLIVSAITSDTRQTGPARIVSLSISPSYQNFVLGQADSDLVVRFRMPLTGRQGGDPPFIVPSVFSTPTRRDIVVTYDGLNLHAYVDGTRRHGIRFGVGAAAFAPLLGRDPRKFYLYDVLFYVLAFVPAGVLASRTGATRLKHALRILSLVAALAALSIVFETTLVIASGRVFSLSNLLLSVACAAAGLVACELARPRAVAGTPRLGS